MAPDRRADVGVAPRGRSLAFAQPVVGFALAALELGVMASGVRLLGAVCVVSGIQPAVAQTLVSIGVELDGLVACHDMEHALRHCVGGA
jgi:hypothetical protein